MSQKIVIAGAGPIGLEAAARAIQDGFDVTVLEQGDTGQGVRHWGHVHLFSPFNMNTSARGRAAVARQTSHTLPPPDAIQSGRQFCESYLQPLAKFIAAQGRVCDRHQVLAVSRTDLGKADRIGQPERAASPFRILCNTPSGETIQHADILLDCTGFISRSKPAGAGGIPCPGEAENLTAANYRIPDITSSDRTTFADRHTLVIGSGYSAATSVQLLSQLAAVAQQTKITWLTRGSRDVPVLPIAEDPLPERRNLTDSVNALVGRVAFLNWLPGTLVDRIDREKDRLRVQLLPPSESATPKTSQLTVDHILVHAGYRPDTQPFEELQVHRCYATDGPIKLAAHLLGETSADCLQQTTGGPELLRNPEPNFYVLGAASYGRNSRFLLKNGIAQVEQLFDLLAEQQGQMND